MAEPQILEKKSMLMAEPQQYKEKLMAEPLLLVMPLVRWQQKVTLGDALAEWRQWIEAEKGS